MAGSTFPSKPVKLTYSSRQRRRRGSVATDDSADELKEDSPSTVKKPAPSKNKTEKKTPKKVDVFLPPPSPKRQRFAPVDEVEADPKPVSKPSSKPRGRTASASSIDTSKLKSSPSTPDVKQSTSSAGIQKPISKVSMKPTSPLSAASNEKPKTTTPQRVVRTESQRMDFLRNHPDCSEFEPHRAFCTRCNRWVALSGIQAYPLTRWNKHVEKCGQRVASLDGASLKADESDNDEEESEDDKVSVAPSVHEKAPMRTVEERRAYLEADPRVQDFGNYEVQCKACSKWIKLGTVRKYMLQNWNRHCRRCSGILPSDRVTTVNRQLQLVNDNQAKTFTSQSVKCASCNGTVVLEGDGEYDLTKWLDHKSICPPAVPNSGASKLAQSSPVREGRPPASHASTEVTVVASEGSPLTRRGGKRPREPDAEGQEDDGRHVRARTDAYDPPNVDVPGIWEWVMLPLKTFIRGFKEGFGTTSASGT